MYDRSTDPIARSQGHDQPAPVRAPACPAIRQRRNFRWHASARACRYRVASEASFCARKCHRQAPATLGPAFQSAVQTCSPRLCRTVHQHTIIIDFIFLKQISQSNIHRTRFYSRCGMPHLLCSPYDSRFARAKAILRVERPSAGGSLSPHSRVGCWFPIRH